MVCPIYEDLRMSLVSEAMLVNPDFGGYSDMQKLCFLFLILEWCGRAQEYAQTLNLL